MKSLFKGSIFDWASWGQVFQSIEAWEPLINFILKKEKLPVSKIENLAPGTNAVFKSGGYVIKIFAPKESGMDGNMDYKSEIFALSFVQSLGVLAPKLIARGEMNDKHNFNYLIMEYIDGITFGEISENFTDDEKLSFAKRLRNITDMFNKPCEAFNGIDVIHDQSRNKRWNKFPEKFKRERLGYLYNHYFGKNVFVHGDLCSDNILFNEKGNIYIIDFADSIIAPQVYEHAHLASELFKFDKTYLRGYFGEYITDVLVDLCFDGLLIHDFGGDIITENIAEINDITCLSDLRDRLYELIESSSA